jgi:hypothetical protein
MSDQVERRNKPRDRETFVAVNGLRTPPAREFEIRREFRARAQLNRYRVTPLVCTFLCFPVRRVSIRAPLADSHEPIVVDGTWSAGGSPLPDSVAIAGLVKAPHASL